MEIQSPLHLARYGRSGPKYDFDGDRKSEMVVWRPATGGWYNVRGQQPQWGAPDDIPVPGDYDGDGKSDVAVWRPRTGEWLVTNSAPFVESFELTESGWEHRKVPSPVYTATQWGQAGDIPVPGDYDGDGVIERVVWRPSTGAWCIENHRDRNVKWGAPEDIPVPGDYNGDGRFDFAVFRPSTGMWHILGIADVQLGSLGDIPVPADYNGDGRTDLAVFMQTGSWLIRLPLATAGTLLRVDWGQPGDVPVAADYDGDGKAEIAIFRPSDGTWPVKGKDTPVMAWGAPTDQPLSAPAAWLAGLRPAPMAVGCRICTDPKLSGTCKWLPLNQTVTLDSTFKDRVSSLELTKDMGIRYWTSGNDDRLGWRGIIYSVGGSYVSTNGSDTNPTYWLNTNDDFDTVRCESIVNWQAALYKDPDLKGARLYLIPDLIRGQDVNLADFDLKDQISSLGLNNNVRLNYTTWGTGSAPSYADTSWHKIERGPAGYVGDNEPEKRLSDNDNFDVVTVYGPWTGL